MDLKFKKAHKAGEIQKIHDYTIDAFSDTPDFSWTLEDLRREIKEGWELYSVSTATEVIAALFFKEEDDSLLTKNTAIKINHQGVGYSHQIKEFFEKRARELKLKKIVHHCRIDNFRMYSLNESHGYKKSSRRLGEDGLLVEWIKTLK